MVKWVKPLLGIPASHTGGLVRVLDALLPIQPSVNA